jgi:hypothetical protein
MFVFKNGSFELVCNSPSNSDRSTLALSWRTDYALSIADSDSAESNAVSAQPSTLYVWQQSNEARAATAKWKDDM